MTDMEKRKFTVISNTGVPNKERTLEEEQQREHKKERGPVSPPNKDFYTNPIYEKLLKYKEEQKKSRFTVEDLLKW